ncbi:18449_t:CDS:1, partial [Racocetra persica]
IGSGKSTVARLFKKYLQKKRYVIYLPEEISLQLKDELEIFYQDTVNNALFFQKVILDTYQKQSENLNRISRLYDFVLLEQTSKDTQ